jgi:hypothetical protein
VLRKKNHVAFKKDNVISPRVSKIVDEVLAEMRAELMNGFFD